MFKRIFLFCFFCLVPLSVYAGDEEILAIIERSEHEPYSKTGAQLQVFRQQLALGVDTHDTLRRMETLQHFQLITLAFMWGSVLFIAYCQRSH